MGNRILIIGSCVTRDTFSFIKNNFQISAYLARTSFASGFCPVPFPEKYLKALGNIESDFQRRMVENDLARTTTQYVVATNSYDIILVDFIDERLNLFEREGTLATISNEFLKIGVSLEDCATQGKIVPSGTMEHFELWKRGFEVFARIVQKHKAQVVINRLFWATHKNDMESFSGECVDKNNKYLKMMYSHIEKNYEFQFIDYNDDMYIADINHKWGVSPFHYIVDLYKSTIDQLDSLT